MCVCVGGGGGEGGGGEGGYIFNIVFTATKGLNRHQPSNSQVWL